MKLAKVEEDEGFNFQHLQQLWTIFLVFNLKFRYSLYFVDSFVLHLDAAYIVFHLLEGTFVRQQGVGKLFPLAYFSQLLHFFTLVQQWGTIH
jgi:hypothetical protein